MRGLHRALVTGAFGGLAGVTVAASVAFACTPEARVRVFEPVNGPMNEDLRSHVNVAGPEAVVDIYNVNYHPLTQTGRDWDPGEVVITLEARPIPGFETPPPIPLTVNPPESGSKVLSLPLPEDLETGTYDVIARQFRVDDKGDLGETQPAPGALVRSTSFEVRVQGGTLQRKPAAPPGPPPSVTTSSSTPPPTQEPLKDPPTTGGGAPPAQHAGSRSGPGSGSSPRADGGSDQAASRPPGPATPSGAGARPAATPTEEILANIPAIPGSDAAKLLDRLNGKQEPVMGDLWSGVDPSGAPSLMDAGWPAEDSSGLPVGGLLLGSGALALAAVALVEGRRRLAYSRVTLR